MKKIDKDGFLVNDPAEPEYDPALPPLSGEILGLFTPFHPRQAMTDILDRTRASRSTVKRRLRQLIRAGLLQRRGKGRETWYTLV